MGLTSQSEAEDNADGKNPHLNQVWMTLQEAVAPHWMAFRQDERGTNLSCQWAS